MVSWLIKTEFPETELICCSSIILYVANYDSERKMWCAALVFIKQNDFLLSSTVASVVPNFSWAVDPPWEGG